MEKQNWKQLVAVSILALVVSVGVAWATPKGTNTRTVVERPSYGGVSSPDINSPYFSVGGVRFWAARTAITTSGTKTGCAIQTPVSSSTLESVSLSITNSTGTTFPVEVGWGTTSGATTTLILSSTVPAAKSLTLNATSTGLEQAFGGLGINEKGILQPNTYINFNFGTTSHPGSSGFCNATFQDAN